MERGRSFGLYMVSVFFNSQYSVGGRIAWPLGLLWWKTVFFIVFGFDLSGAGGLEYWGLLKMWSSPFVYRWVF